MGKVATEATLQEGVNLLRVLAKGSINYFENYKAIQDIVRAGEAPNFFEIGDQIVVTWSDGTTEYEMPMDVVHFGDVVNEDGDTVPGMYLQSHYALPGVQFDRNEAFYVVEGSALPAGTYYFTFGNTWGSIDCIAGNSFYFTTTEAIPVGGQLVIGRASDDDSSLPDRPSSTWRIRTYNTSSDTTPVEVLELTAGTSGTSLGTLTTATKYSESGINNLQRASYGYSRWSQSAIRQWLNSNEAINAWWTPQNPFDRPPAQLSTMQGFMAGLSSDFLSIVNPVKVTTALNVVSDSTIGTTEDTYDRFFLPSLEQEWCVPQLSGAEGSYWEYWKERLGTSTPQASGAANALTEHIRYAITNHASAQAVRLRSAYRGYASYVWYVSSTGHVGYPDASHVIAPAPACVIC